MYPLKKNLPTLFNRKWKKLLAGVFVFYRGGG